MDQFLGRTKIPNGKVGAYRAKLEAEGYHESERGNGVTIYENGEGGSVTFEQVSPRRVAVTCWRTIDDAPTPAPSR